MNELQTIDGDPIDIHWYTLDQYDSGQYWIQRMEYPLHGVFYALCFSESSDADALVKCMLIKFSNAFEFIDWSRQGNMYEYVPEEYWSYYPDVAEWYNPFPAQEERLFEEQGFESFYDIDEMEFEHRGNFYHVHIEDYDIWTAIESAIKTELAQ